MLCLLCFALLRFALVTEKLLRWTQLVPGSWRETRPLIYPLESVYALQSVLPESLTWFQVFLCLSPTAISKRSAVHGGVVVTCNLLHVSWQAGLRPLRKPATMPSPGGIPPGPLSPAGQAEARNYNFTPLLLVGPFI